MQESSSNRIAMFIVIVLVLLSLCCCCLITSFYLESEAQMWSNMFGSLTLTTTIG
jgi:hypothetical protein